MANSYKVPQDVEAEDKLIGPFSFRQFIYLGIVAMALAAAWGLFLLFPLLSVIPLPVVVFFGALALPLRKDQPMETYLAAMWQFYIKPRNRMWMADGVVSRITIDIPLVVERQLTKNLTSQQAINQFDYLSQIADTGGWSTRGVAHAPLAVVDNPEIDIMDSTSQVAQSFDTRLQQVDDQRREDLLARVHSGSIAEEVPRQSAPQIASQPIADPAVPFVPDYSGHHEKPEDYHYEEAPVFNPTPQFMQQHVLQPLDPNHAARVEPVQHAAPDELPQPQVEQPQEIAPEPSAPVANPAIMELAEVEGVSLETVAKQLHHKEEVERHGDEIVINLH